MMKAVVLKKYGSPDGLVYQEVPRPTIKDNEILVKVQATTVTAGDSEVRALKFPLWLAIPIRLWLGVFRPRNAILGQELAGEVVQVGKDVTQFQIGDNIFGTTGVGFGAYAEYIRLEAKSEEGVLTIKPSQLTFEQAAAVPTAGLEALHFLRKGNIQSGDRVLIVGAGGSIGTYGIQIAKHFGAHVTAVDSTGKLDMMRSIGADEVVDFTQEDFTQNGKKYDVIFDVIGKSVYGRSMNSLSDHGRYLLANPKLMQMIRGRWDSTRSNRNVIFGAVDQREEDLKFLAKLITDGTIKPVIDRQYPLEQTADAHHYVETGQKKGNVVIAVAT